MNDEQSGSEKRQSVRAKQPIEVEYSADCPWIRARLDDLSEDGAFIDTQHALSKGAEMKLRFTLPDEGEQSAVECRGRVVWSEPMVGIGVRFFDVDEATRERIRFFVASRLFGW